MEFLGCGGFVAWVKASTCLEARGLGGWEYDNLEAAASDADALRVLKQQVSQDADWRVQEILAKAFDQFCHDIGYEAALPVIREWLSDASANTQRAVTEGLRIWTGRPYFRDHPEVAIALLSALREEDSEYLRDSVGNALRDISKKHPALVGQEVRSWDLALSLAQGPKSFPQGPDSVPNLFVS